MINKFSDDQLTIILGIYYFNKNKMTQNYVKTEVERFNEIYSCDISQQTMSYVISQYKNVDPSFNTIINEDTFIQKLKKIWDFYIANDRIKDLKEKYLLFKQYKKPEQMFFDETEAFNKHYNEITKNMVFNYKGDYVKPLYDRNVTEINVHKRDANVAYNALKMANFKCEYDSSHISFLRKKSNEIYMEGHHLIPLEFQDKFDVNLDVEANIVSLCSQCHNLIHYGCEYETLLKKLYDSRIERLKQCGINITFEQLVEMYK